MRDKFYTPLACGRVAEDFSKICDKFCGIAYNFRKFLCNSLKIPYNFSKICLKCNTTPFRESPKILLKFFETTLEKPVQFYENLSKIVRAT